MAVCAVVLTAGVVFFGVPVGGARHTYGGEELNSRVLEILENRGELDGLDDENSVICPSSVTVRSGHTFSCLVKMGSITNHVRVSVTESGEFEAGDLIA